MGKKNRKKQIYLSYTFDRLAQQKLSQVYRLLVPDRFATHENKEGNHITCILEKGLPVRLAKPFCPPGYRETK